MITLRHFAASEFKRPDAMNPDFLRLLDDVRDTARFPFNLTSDARTVEQNAAASGSNPTSLHLSGRAVDFAPDVWDDEHLYAIAAAVAVQGVHSVELEIVDGKGAIPAAKITPSVVAAIRQAPDESSAMSILTGLQSHDRHVHFGLFPDARPSRLEIAVD